MAGNRLETIIEIDVTRGSLIRLETILNVRKIAMMRDSVKQTILDHSLKAINCPERYKKKTPVEPSKSNTKIPVLCDISPKPTPIEQLAPIKTRITEKNLNPSAIRFNPLGILENLSIDDFSSCSWEILDTEQFYIQTKPPAIY